MAHNIGNVAVYALEGKRRRILGDIDDPEIVENVLLTIMLATHHHHEIIPDNIEVVAGVSCGGKVGCAG